MMEREFNSTIVAIAQRLQIGNKDVEALVRAVDVATQRLCPLWAAWALYHVTRRRFGGDAAVAATTAALLLSCGRADKDALIDCAVRRCSAYGNGVRTADADNIAATVRDIGRILGLADEDAGYISGLLKYRFLQALGAVEVDIRGHGALIGELLAYATQLVRKLPQ